MTDLRILRPKSLQEASAILANEPDARCLAGGATLVALMNARLAEPTVLVNLEAIPELAGVSQGSNGRLRIGAMTRHRETAEDVRLSGSLAVVREAARSIANPVVRNMGTLGGSIAFFDPAADYPPALVAAEAEIEVASVRGARRIAAADFFVDWYTTALHPGEIVVAVHLPSAEATVARYRKLARVSGDYAVVSVAVALTGAVGGTDAQGARIAIGGCGPRPIRLPDAEAAVAGALRDPKAVARAGALLAAAADPVDDVRASAAYRRRVIPRLLASSLAACLEPAA